MGTLDIRSTNKVWWKWEVFAIPVSVGKVTWEDLERQRVNDFFSREQNLYLRRCRVLY